MADLVFAFDAALDRPIPVPEAAPSPVADAIALAPFEALQAAASTARQTRAAGLVLFGNTLDPIRSSPAQAAALRTMITSLAADGCRTVWVADESADCANVSRALAEPEGLSFVTPVSPLRLDMRGLSVEICSTRGPAYATTGFGRMPQSFASAHSSLLPAQRRIVIGWDDAWGSLHGEPAVSHGLHAPLPADGRSSHGPFFVWGSRSLQATPPGMHQLSALQARSGREASAGLCAVATLTNLPTRSPTLSSAPHVAADPRTDWREVPTHRVAWRTLTITSLIGDEEELAALIWSALEGMSLDADAPLQIVRCAIDCGGSINRRVHIGELSVETVERVRALYDPRTFRAWCQELEADRTESPATLVRNASASNAGGAASFASGLAEIVLEMEKTAVHPGAREAGWIALELLASS